MRRVLGLWVEVRDEESPLWSLQERRSELDGELAARRFARLHPGLQWVRRCARGHCAEVSRRGLLAAALLWVAAAEAAENLPSEDPAWAELRDAVASGREADLTGGVQSVSRRESHEGAWVGPLRSATLRALLDSEPDRSYSTPQRPRQLAGGIAVSCDYQEGRPCGDGAAAGIELDSAAGYGDLLTAATRIRLAGGSAQNADGLEIERAYLKL